MNLGKRIDEANIKAEQNLKEADALIDSFKELQCYYFKAGYDAGLEEGRKNERKR